jgi:hypothetical protein
MYAGGNRRPQRKPTLSERVVHSITWAIGLTSEVTGADVNFEHRFYQTVCHSDSPKIYQIDQIRKSYDISCTLTILWNSVHYWGSNRSFCVFHKAPHKLRAPAPPQHLQADSDSFSESATNWTEKFIKSKIRTIYRVSSADKHTIKIWWNSVHYWGSLIAAYVFFTKCLLWDKL